MSVPSLFQMRKDSSGDALCQRSGNCQPPLCSCLAGQMPLPAGCAVVEGWDDDHLDSDRGTQQVNHLVVGQCDHGHLADFHQPAALPEAGLPGKPIVLHLGHGPVVLHVEAQLPESVPPQGHVHCLPAVGHHLQETGEIEPQKLFGVSSEGDSRSDSPF